MVTVSLFLSNLSLCLSLLVCNKTLGPAVALIELWDRISSALDELDRLSMALCCVILVPINKRSMCMCASDSSPFRECYRLK